MTNVRRAAGASNQAFDPQLDRAEEIMHERAERLGKNYPRTKHMGGVCQSVRIDDVSPFVKPGTKRIRIDVDATANGVKAKDAKAAVQELLRPLIADARREIKDTMKTEFPVDVVLALTHTKRFEFTDSFG